MENWHSYACWLDMMKPSQPPVYRDVTGKMNDILILNYIKNVIFKTYKSVFEIAFLQEFDALDTISNILNPKYVVQIMLQRYNSNIASVCMEPNLSQTFIFMFNVEGYEHTFLFSNCMTFHEDISIICFLYHIARFNSTYSVDYYNFKTSETVQILTQLMRNKYKINFDHELIPIENKLTISDIAHCFPSITWDMIHNNYNHIGPSIIFVDNSILFTDFYLPRTIFIPVITTILPKLEDPPIAILVAISVKLRDNFNMPAPAPKYPLDLIYNQILQTYNYSIIPERLKLELCMRWNIVVKQNNIYKFAPCFAVYRLKALCLISELRSNDPKLEDILSKI